MIEARFDDLTGEAPSFRLTDPAGVLEATRPEDVAPTLAAAEGAAARGLWVAGFVAYEAAPGMDASLVVRDAGAGRPVRSPAVGLVRDVRAAPGDRPAVAARRCGPAVRRVGPDRGSGQLRPGDRRIREHIAAGDTYQVNHTFRLRSTVQGDERGLYRDLCYAQRGARRRI